MGYFIRNKSVIVSVLLLFICISCAEEEESPKEFVEQLPQVHPEEINRFQEADSVYFGHLAYETISLEDGTFLIPLHRPIALIRVNEEGNLIEVVAQSGRGPGEVLDLLFTLKKDSGEVLIYDQKNEKILRFNQKMEFVEEFVPKPFESASIIGIYPALKSERYLMKLSSTDFLFEEGKKPKLYLSRYDTGSDSYNKKITLKRQAFAHLIIDDRPAGGRFVPFSPSQLLSYHPENQTLYTYWTGSSQIAEISANFDTLRTIPINLPSQSLSSAERDSIKTNIQPASQWETLGDLLPDVKAPVNKMKLDNKGRFWLKLNYRGNTDKWLIMDREGEFQKIVHLPRGSMLTHISDNHLGIRLDDITFALYEPVE